ncbi:MAG: hypothetical protein NT040_16695 [Bacteroidetes bacterium]|nr:hypothetical protein [Bacteroidota bacterium]
MRPSCIIILFFVLLTGSRPSFGQDAVKCSDTVFNDPLLEKIIGTWNVTGQIGKDKITYNFKASWELNHQFVELAFSDTAVQPQYTAMVFIGFNCISERYVAHWLDNFGGRFSETLGYGIKLGQSIEFRFEYPDGPFMNKFIYDEKAGNWQFHTTTKNRKGDWITFGDMYLKR